MTQTLEQLQAPTAEATRSRVARAVALPSTELAVVLASSSMPTGYLALDEAPAVALPKLAAWAAEGMAVVSEPLAWWLAYRSRMVYRIAAEWSAIWGGAARATTAHDNASLLYRLAGVEPPARCVERHADFLAAYTRIGLNGQRFYSGPFVPPRTSRQAPADW